MHRWRDPHKRQRNNCRLGRRGLLTPWRLLRDVLAQTKPFGPEMITDLACAALVFFVINEIRNLFTVPFFMFTEIVICTFKNRNGEESTAV